MPPLVSVIIPCFNAGRFIEETIYSVLRQTFNDLEILVINDGSTDNSEAIVKGIHDSRIQLLTKENTGVSDSRNVGLEKSCSEFICFLDADDLLAEDFLEKRISFLSGDKRNVIAGGKYILINETGTRVGAILSTPGEDGIKQILLFSPLIGTGPSAFLIRRSFLSTYQIRFETSLSSTADKLFLLQIAQHTTFGRIEGGELFYRVHSKSMSNQYSSDLVDDNERYFTLIEAMNLVPEHLKKRFLSVKWYNLAASNFKVKRYARAFHFLKLFLFSYTGLKKS